MTVFKITILQEYREEIESYVIACDIKEAVEKAMEAIRAYGYPLGTRLIKVEEVGEEF